MLLRGAFSDSGSEKREEKSSGPQAACISSLYTTMAVEKSSRGQGAAGEEEAVLERRMRTRRGRLCTVGGC